MSTPIGIDFGTSKTLATWINPANGHPAAIRLGRGRDEIPTTVYLCEDGTLLFGDDADDNAQFDFSSYARGFKLSLGSKMPLLIGAGKSYSARQLTRAFLKHIKERCEKEAVMAPVTSAVITVPAIFSPAQRDDLLGAAKGAGFSNVELLPEPIAAGMAFCGLSPRDAFEGSILVVDWGGGTLDLAIVSRARDGRFETVQGLVDGSSGIGGEALDEAMWKLVAELLAEDGGIDLASEPVERRGGQLTVIRQAKEMLSTRDEHRVALLTTRGPKGIVVSRSRFNSAIMSHVEQGAAKAFAVIDAARQQSHKPLFVLLVGGTCKVPLVHQAIESSTKMDCRVWQYSREAVAFGAALAAAPANGRVPRVDERSPFLAQYRTALAMANSDGRVDSAEATQLYTLRKQLQLTVEEAERIESEVLGRELAACVPHAAGGLDAEAQRLLVLATQLQNQSNLEEAQQHAQAACDICPECVEPFVAKGMILKARGIHPLAAAAFTRALQLDPDNHLAREQRAWSRLELGQIDEADDDFYKVLTKVESSGCRLGRAYVHTQRQRFADAFRELEALHDPALLATLNAPPGGIQAVAAWLLLRKLGKGAEAIEWLSSALSVMGPNEPALRDFLFWFTGARLNIGIADELQKWLWKACESVHGPDTRDAAVLFVRKNPRPLNWRHWRKPRFLLLIASVAAEACDDYTAVTALRELCDVDKSFDISKALSEKHIASRRGQSAALNEFLTPTITATENHGVLLNDVTITNTSPFRVTEVEMTATYERIGVGRQSSTRKCGALDAGEIKQWSEVFKDAGWFGGSLNDVKLEVTCAEGRLRVPIPGTKRADGKSNQPAKIPRPVDPCPKCGNSLGAGVTRCWFSGCDYVLPKRK